MSICQIHHVQLAMPSGEEEAAREFYSGLLGIPEVPKPPVLAARGGVWFESGGLRIHLGVEADFRPPKKAHPAFRVIRLTALAAKLREASVPVIDDDLLPGFQRIYACDPFGNRLEFLEPCS